MYCANLEPGGLDQVARKGLIGAGGQSNHDEFEERCSGQQLNKHLALKRTKSIPKRREKRDG